MAAGDERVGMVGQMPEEGVLDGSSERQAAEHGLLKQRHHAWPLWVCLEQWAEVVGPELGNRIPVSCQPHRFEDAGRGRIGQVVVSHAAESSRLGQADCPPDQRSVTFVERGQHLPNSVSRRLHRRCQRGDGEHNSQIGVAAGCCGGRFDGREDDAAERETRHRPALAVRWLLGDACSKRLERFGNRVGGGEKVVVPQVGEAGSGMHIARLRGCRFEHARGGHEPAKTALVCRNRGKPCGQRRGQVRDVKFVRSHAYCLFRAQVTGKLYLFSSVVGGSVLR